MQAKRHTDKKVIPQASIGHKKAMRTCKSLGEGIKIHNVPDGIILEENGQFYQLLIAKEPKKLEKDG